MNGAFYVNQFIKNLQKKKCYGMKFWPAYVSLILIAPGPNSAPFYFYITYWSRAPADEW